MKPILTPELLDTLLADLSRGDMTPKQIAERAGLRPHTLRCWLSYGSRAHALLETLVRCSALVRAAAVGREKAVRQAQELVRAAEQSAQVPTTEGGA